MYKQGIRTVSIQHTVRVGPKMRESMTLSMKADILLEVEQGLCRVTAGDTPGDLGPRTARGMAAVSRGDKR